jgi:hypothetical protein
MRKQSLEERDFLNPSPTKPQSPNTSHPIPTTSSFYKSTLVKLGTGFPIP